MEKITSAQKNVYENTKSSLPCQFQPYGPRGTHLFVNPREHLRSVVPSTSARNDLSHSRQPRHQHSGKLLRHTMRAIRWVIQRHVDFFYLLAYPLCQAKKFHKSIIDGSTRATGKCSEPRVHIVFLVYLMTLFTVAYAHNPQPVVDLNNGFSNYAIHFGQKTFQLVYDDNGIVMTNSDLIRRHQLMSISRVIDHTEIALANSLVRTSLSSYEQVTTQDNFTWIGDKIYHLSHDNMTFLDCQIYCATRSSDMLKTVKDVWRVDHR